MARESGRGVCGGLRTLLLKGKSILNYFEVDELASDLRSSA
jgi:hypothetical protein